MAEGDLRVWVLEGAAPPAVIEEALAASEHAVLIEREGAGPGSLTDEGLRYMVCDGFAVSEHAPLVHRWAREVVPVLASAACGIALQASPDAGSAVNINVLAGRGERYEPHVDSNPITAILFCTGGHEGGELVARPAMGVEVVMIPVLGNLAVFAGDVPHLVAPLIDEGPRVTVPVAMYPAGVESVDRGELDAHLYADQC